VEIDRDGNPILAEEFSDTVSEFRDWCKTQEKTLHDLFYQG
jgi:type I restriction enzyme M protein